MERNAESAAERAYVFIRDGILEGRFSNGEMLGETGIAAELSMSRTPIRSALLRLQEEQWITIYPKRGALVNGLSDRAIADLVDARFVLETASVQRAVPGCLTHLTGRLWEQLEEQREAFAAEDLKRFIGLTAAFHRSFVEASGNEVLVELGDRLADRQRYALFKLGSRLLERCEHLLEEHRQLILALEAGDPDRFSRVLREHINDVHTEHILPDRPLEQEDA